MKLFSVIAFAFANMLSVLPAHADGLPSGQVVDLHEVLIDHIDDATLLRFRFVAPAISRDGGSVDAEQATQDMAFLCEQVALPYMQEHSLAGDQIIISLSDQETEFGQPAPDATQFFEAFTPQKANCIWEMF